jgi:hypothetical protein
VFGADVIDAPRPQCAPSSYSHSFALGKANSISSDFLTPLCLMPLRRSLTYTNTHTPTQTHKHKQTHEHKQTQHTFWRPRIYIASLCVMVLRRSLAYITNSHTHNHTHNLTHVNTQRTHCIQTHTNTNLHTISQTQNTHTQTNTAYIQAAATPPRCTSLLNLSQWLTRVK